MADKKTTDALRQLDELDLSKLKLDDLKTVKNPVVAQVLREFLISQEARSHHNSHFVHISHFSSFVRPEEILTTTVKGKTKG